MSGFGPAQGTFGGSATFTNLTVTGTATFASTVTVTGGTIAAPSQFNGVPYFGPAARDGTQLTVMDATNAAVGVIQWTSNAGSSGEMIHLTGGPANTGSGGSGPSLIACGLNYGGVGILVNNYTTGVGIKVANLPTGSNAAAWGFLLSQQSNYAEGMYLSQEASTNKMLLKVVSAPIGSIAGAGAATGQLLSAWYRSQAATADTLLFHIAVDNIQTSVPIKPSTDSGTDIGATASRFSAGYFATVQCTGASNNIGVAMSSTVGLRLGSAHQVTFSSTTAYNGSADLYLTRHSAANLRQGAAASNDADGVAQTLRSPSGGTVSAGTTGKNGGAYTITAGNGSDAKSGSNANGGNGGILTLTGGAKGLKDGGGSDGLDGGVQVSRSGGLLGFYGVSPIARAVLATGTGATVDNVITALQNLGLVSQS